MQGFRDAELLGGPFDRKGGVPPRRMKDRGGCLGGGIVDHCRMCRHVASLGHGAAFGDGGTTLVDGVVDSSGNHSDNQDNRQPHKDADHDRQDADPVAVRNFPPTLDEGVEEDKVHKSCIVHAEVLQ